jgi:site-specific DNA recombinase
MKVCAYCRVSSAKTEQLNSLENQILHYTALFQQSGITPAKVGMLCKSNGEIEYRDDGLFIDEGLSGTSIKYRKAFNKMMELVCEHEFDRIYVKNVERWARNVADAELALDKCEQNDVEVIFEDMPNSPTRLLVGIYFQLAKEDSVKKSISVRWGKEQSYKKGKFNSGKPPYGYDLEKESNKLIINEYEAEMVKKMYDLYLKDLYGYRSIAIHLNENNIPTKYGARKGWDITAVQHILCNTAYVGKLLHRRTMRKSLTEKKRTPIPQGEYIYSELPELRILDNETFKQALEQREKRGGMTKDKLKHSSTNLFSSLLYCGDCGGVYRRKQRTKRKEVYKWVCSSNDLYKNESKRGCAYRKSLYEECLLADIKNKVKELQDKDLGGLLEIYKILYYDYDLSEERINELRVQEEKLKKRATFNFNLYADGIHSESQYKELNLEIQNELETVRVELDSIKNYERRINKLYSDYNKFKKSLEEFDFDNITNASLKKVFKKIIVKRFTTLPTDKELYHIIYYYSFLDVSYEEILNKIKRMGKEVFSEKARERGLEDVSLSYYLLSTITENNMTVIHEDMGD